MLTVDFENVNPSADTLHEKLNVTTERMDALMAHLNEVKAATPNSNIFDDFVALRPMCANLNELVMTVFNMGFSVGVHEAQEKIMAKLLASKLAETTGTATTEQQH